MHLIAGRTSVTDDRLVLSTAVFEICSSVLDVIHCIGSFMPVSRTLELNFIMEWDFPPIFVVSVTITEIWLDDDDAIQGRLCVSIPPKPTGPNPSVST